MGQSAPVAREGPRLKVVPLELKAANELVATHHRHHKPVVGHRFSIGVIDEDGVLRGGPSWVVQWRAW